MSKALALIIIAVAVALGITAPKSAIKSIAPDRAQNDSKVVLKIMGDKFTKDNTIKLARDGEQDILPQAVAFVSKNEIDCAFEFRGQAAGAWDVVLLDKARKMSTAAKAFTLENPAPALTKVQPNQAEENTKVNLTITGARFRKGLKVNLAKEGQNVRDASASDMLSAVQASAGFDLQGLAPGVYDLVLLNDDGKSATLPRAFTVTKAPEPVPPAPAEPPIDIPELNLRLVRTLGSIFFDFDKAEIRQDQLSTLETNVKAVTENLELFIVIGGNADERGSEDYNNVLSAKRANAIKAYLVKMGVAEDRIIIYAYGKRFPQLVGHDESAWAYNRRVDCSLWRIIPSAEEAVPGKTNK